MARPTTLQVDFSAGVKQDFPRNAMPKGSFYNGHDLIPNIVGRLRERGGWSNGSDSISAVKSSASQVMSGIYAPYTAGACQVVIDDDGEVYQVTDDTTVTDVGAGVLTAQIPVFHRDLVIIPGATGLIAPHKVSNSSGTLTIANLGGSPPDGIYAAVWGDYSLLGNTAAEPQRLYFSDPGDPESWDTTNSVWDFTQPINGLAVTRSFIVAFHDGTMSRLRGTTPPPGSDFFNDDPLFTVGCTDARSIAVDGDRIMWCNGEGIWLTDGSAKPVNVAELCGMLTYWQSMLTAYDKSTWTLAGGFLRGKYFFSAMNGTASVQFAGFIDLNSLSWWPLNNVDAHSFWPAQGSTDKLYFGPRAARVGELSSIFMPSSSNKNDGDGTAVTSTFESPYYEGPFGAKTLKKIYVDHQLTDYGTDNPTATIGYITTPEDSTYTTLSTGLAESATKTTTKAVVGGAVDGFAVKIARANAGDFLLYGVEAEIEAREPSRRAA